MSDTIIVNLFGGPGSGKSTGAAYIFSELKMRGINVELVTEFAKDKVWENNHEVFKDQLYIFGKQHFKINRVLDKVDVIITDSPLLLSAVYNSDPVLGDKFNSLVNDVFKSFNNLNFLINRVKKYNPNGRHQSEEESNIKHLEIIKMLTDYEVKYKRYNGCKTNYDFIVYDILVKLKDMGKLTSVEEK